MTWIIYVTKASRLHLHSQYFCPPWGLSLVPRYHSRSYNFWTRRRHSDHREKLTCVAEHYTTGNMLWDYIFVGGGLAGSVVSNRLLEFNSSLKILVLEAGPNANNDPSVVWPNSTNLIGGDYDWNLTSVPQTHVGNRSISLPQGKALGGGTVINSGTYPQFGISLFVHNIGN